MRYSILNIILFALTFSITQNFELEKLIEEADRLFLSGKYQSAIKSYQSVIESSEEAQLHQYTTHCYNKLAHIKSRLGINDIEEIYSIVDPVISTCKQQGLRKELVDALLRVKISMKKPKVL